MHHMDKRAHTWPVPAINSSYNPCDQIGVPLYQCGQRIIITLKILRVRHKTQLLGLFQVENEYTSKVLVFKVSNFYHTFQTHSHYAYFSKLDAMATWCGI